MLRHCLFAASVALGMSACAGTRAHAPLAPVAPDTVVSRCWTCATIPMDEDVSRALRARIDELRDRGGECGVYGAVLESSLRSGRISMKPSMWRHEGRLVAGEASPSGDMSLAREIDSLNVGRRGVDEVLWSMEHEAAHIAFAIPSSSPEHEAVVNSRVRSCRT